MVQKAIASSATLVKSMAGSMIVSGPNLAAMLGMRTKDVDE